MTTFLTSVRAINEAIFQSAMGKQGYVKCEEFDGQVSRIIQARKRSGRLQVRRLHDGEWVHPLVVWWEDK